MRILKLLVMKLFSEYDVYNDENLIVDKISDEKELVYIDCINKDFAVNNSVDKSHLDSDLRVDDVLGVSDNFVRPVLCNGDLVMDTEESVLCQVNCVIDNDNIVTVP